ncbi:exported protein of unknown function [Streptomyces murinus]
MPRRAAPVPESLSSPLPPAVADSLASAAPGGRGRFTTTSCPNSDRHARLQPPRARDLWITGAHPPGDTRTESHITVIFTPSVTVRSFILSTAVAHRFHFGYWEGRPTPCPQTSPSSDSAPTVCRSPRPRWPPASPPSAMPPDPRRGR